LAAKQNGLVQSVVAFNEPASALDTALERQVIDEASFSVAEAIRDADLILVSVPVALIETILVQIAESCLVSGINKCELPLILDVGSTKSSVARAAEQICQSHQIILSQFVPSHPICGREVSGVEYADASLYDQCRVVMTPSSHTSLSAIQTARHVWQAIGAHSARIEVMSAQAHDQIYAAVSHLPHLISFAFMNSLLHQRQQQLEQHRGHAEPVRPYHQLEPNFRQLDAMSFAGPGFRDFTRIAASNADMWGDIFEANQHHVLAQLQALKHELSMMEDMIVNNSKDQLKEYISQASKCRSGWQLNSSPSTHVMVSSPSLAHESSFSNLSALSSKSMSSIPSSSEPSTSISTESSFSPSSHSTLSALPTIENHPKSPSYLISKCKIKPLLLSPHQVDALYDCLQAVADACKRVQPPVHPILIAGAFDTLALHRFRMSV
jgi:prephenate dehydrogenase